jgi:hypothetical protein
MLAAVPVPKQTCVRSRILNLSTNRMKLMNITAEDTAPILMIPRTMP